MRPPGISGGGTRADVGHSSGHRGQGDCICTLLMIRVNRAEEGGVLLRVGGHRAL